MKRILKSFPLVPNRKRKKHSDIQDLSFCCGKHCGSALIRDRGRLFKERLHREPEKMQVVETSFLTPELGLAGSLQTHSLSPGSVHSHSPHCSCLAALGPTCFCFTVGCSGLFGACRKTSTHALRLSLLHLLHSLLTADFGACSLSASCPHGPLGAQLQTLPKLNIDQNLFQPTLVARSGGRYTSSSLLVQSPKPGEEFGARLTSKDV